MQTTSDILLGWNHIANQDGIERDFYVRQLRDWKGTVEMTQMSLAALSAYGEVCAWTLARAHARAGDRIAIASYLGSATVFDNAVTDFAAGYAEQNRYDYQAMLAAIATGRLSAG